jgi:signal transduction histidine kinase
LELEWEPGVEVPLHLEPLAQSVALEALRNAERHSPGGARRVTVARTPGAFELVVANDGVAGARARGAGLGLRILTLEALQHNGLLEFGHEGDDGWRVRLIVPTADD